MGKKGAGVAGVAGGARHHVHGSVLANVIYSAASSETALENSVRRRRTDK